MKYRTNKKTNEQTKQMYKQQRKPKPTDTNNRMVSTREEGGEGRTKRVKGVNYMVMEGD